MGQSSREEQQADEGRSAKWEHLLMRMTPRRVSQRKVVIFSFFLTLRLIIKNKKRLTSFVGRFLFLVINLNVRKNEKITAFPCDTLCGVVRFKRCAHYAERPASACSSSRDD
jgi:hypothetical protein